MSLTKRLTINTTLIVGAYIIRPEMNKTINNQGSSFENPNCIDNLVRIYNSKTSTNIISINPNGLPFIKYLLKKGEIMYREDMDNICKNPKIKYHLEILDILKNKLDPIHWNFLCSHKSIQVVNWIIKNFKNPLLIDKLSSNSLAAKWLLQPKNQKYINWNYFSINSSDLAINYLLKHPEKINFGVLCLNKNEKVLKILEKNIHRISWQNLSKNGQKWANKFLMKYPEQCYLKDMVENSKDWKFIVKNINKVKTDIDLCSINCFGMKNIAKKTYCVALLNLSSPKLYKECLEILDELDDTYTSMFRDYNNYICVEHINKNPHPKVIEALLSKHKHRIIPFAFSNNSSIWYYQAEKKLANPRYKYFSKWADF